MACEFKLLSVLWLVAACIASTPATAGPTNTTTADPTITTTAGPTNTTTADPTITTTAGPTITTTADPTITTTAGPTNTTTAGPTITTTADPTNTTTADPTITTTAGPTNTTTADPTITTTADPTITTTAGPTTTTTAVTTPTADPCKEGSCGDGSTCEPRSNQDFVCLCLAGDFYNHVSKSCENAKVFPGQLKVPGLTYDDKMRVKTSPEFQNASQKIIDQLSTVFKASADYSGSIVLELLPIINNKVWSRSENGVNASVEITFTANAPIKTTDVTQAISEATKCEGCLLQNASFKDADLCDKNACDRNTAACLSEDGSYNCTCKENYIKTDFSSRMCIACPSGQKAEGSGCVDCPFGYSGFNCNESWQLVLVIVGSVLGGLVLITLILLPIVAHKCSKKSSKTNKNADIPYVSHSPARAPLINHSLANSHAAPVNGSASGLAACANAGVPRIPRATATSNWDSRTNLEMSSHNSWQNQVPVGRNSRLYEDKDVMNPYAQARPQNNPYAQNRPQNNPYAQNRPQNNPYASSQGQTNPNYMHDDGRRFY